MGSAQPRSVVWTKLVTWRNKPQRQQSSYTARVVEPAGQAAHTTRQTDKGLKAAEWTSGAEWTSSWPGCRHGEAVGSLEVKEKSAEQFERTVSIEMRLEVHKTEREGWKATGNKEARIPDCCHPLGEGSQITTNTQALTLEWGILVSSLLGSEIPALVKGQGILTSKQHLQAEAFNAWGLPKNWNAEALSQLQYLPPPAPSVLAPPPPAPPPIRNYRKL